MDSRRSSPLSLDDGCEKVQAPLAAQRKHMEALALSCRIFVAFVFLSAGASKLFRVREFEEAVANYRLLPRRAAVTVARLLPWVELLAGSLLLVGALTSAVALLLILALLTFSTAITINLVRGKTIDCGCFSLAAPRRITWSSVVRNLGLAAMTTLVLVRSPDVLSVDSRGSTTTMSHQDAVAISITSIVVLLAISLVGEARAFRRAHEQFLAAASLER